MLDEDKQRQVTILIITGIVIVSIVTICMLISIWMPNKKGVSENEYVVGKVEFDKITTEDVVKKYYSEIFALMLDKDYEALYNKLNKDYIEYTGLTVTKLKDKLENANVSGKLLNLTKYNDGSYDNKLIYTLNLKSQTDAYDINMVIIEESPNDYTIAFDDFVGIKYNSYDNTLDSLNIKINKVIYYTSKVVYEVTLKNGYNNNIVLNSEKLYEGINLLDYSENLIQPSSVVFAGRTVNMIPNETKSINVTFDIEELTYYNLKGLVIRNVLYSDTQKVKDITFVF